MQFNLLWVNRLLSSIAGIEANLNTTLKDKQLTVERNVICLYDSMKRLQRLEFIFLYERFIEKNNQLNKAVMEGRNEEVRLLQHQVNELYNRMKDHKSPAVPAFSN